MALKILLLTACTYCIWSSPLHVVASTGTGTASSFVDISVASNGTMWLAAAGLVLRGCGMMTPECLGDSWGTCKQQNTSRFGGVVSPHMSPSAQALNGSNGTLYLALHAPSTCYQLHTMTMSYDLCAALTSVTPCALVLDPNTETDTIKTYKPAALVFDEDTDCLIISAEDVLIQGVSVLRSLLPSSCIRCRAGTAAAIGSNECLGCPADTYAPAGAQQCLPCTPINCSAGSFPRGCNRASDNTCTLCRTSCGAGMTRIGSCTPERAADWGCAACLATCPAGEELDGECNFTSSPQCRPCPNGTFKSTSGGGPCQRCTELDKKHQDCPAGTQASQCTSLFDAGASCLACPSGTYRQGAFKQGCSRCMDAICPKGEENICLPTSGERRCIGCQAGKYKDTESAAMCKTCGITCECGYLSFCNRTSAGTCRLCTGTRCFARNTQLTACPSARPVALQDLVVGDRVRCVRRTSLDKSATFEVSCCAVIGWLHAEHSKGPGYVHLQYHLPNGQAKTLSASQRHIAYVYRGSPDSATPIAFNDTALTTVTFAELSVGDSIAVYDGSNTSSLALVPIESVRYGDGEGAYVVLLEGGGSPIVEGALMSMSSVVAFPGFAEAANVAAFDLDVVTTFALAPFISSWNGTASLLDELGVKRSAKDMDNYQVHRDVFPEPVAFWDRLRQETAPTASSTHALGQALGSIAAYWWQRWLSQQTVALEEFESLHKFDAKTVMV